MLPASSRFVVVGAGIHGLSTAYHLAASYGSAAPAPAPTSSCSRRRRPGAGATGHRLRRRPQQLLPARDERADAGLRRGVGVRSRGVPLQRGRLHRARRRRCRRATSPPTFERQERIGYRSELDRRRGRGRRAHEGALPRLAREGRHRLPPRAPGRLRLQRRVGARPARQVPRARASQIHSYVEVTGFELGDDDTVTARRDRAAGRIEVGEQVVIAPGPWAKRFWAHARPARRRSTSTRRPATSSRDQPMWTYWNLQEGEITVDPLMFATADGGAPPVIHLDTDAPLYTDDGELVTDELWGIYFKRDRHGVQGGASPLDGRRRRRARPVPVDDGRRRRASRTCGAPRSRTR